MANPNPFLFADPPPADNPFLDTGAAEANPFMAQQVPQQSFGYQGHQGHYGQVEQANPFGDPYSSMGHGGPASMGYAGHDPASMMYYGQQQQGQYNQYGQQQFASMPAQSQYNQMGHMAHMNTHTNSVASGAAAFGVTQHDPSAAFGMGAAAFGVTSPPTATGAAAFGVADPIVTSGAAVFGVPDPLGSTGAAAFGVADSVVSTGPAAFGVTDSVVSTGPAAFGVADSVVSTGPAAFGVSDSVVSTGPAAFGVSDSVLPTDSVAPSGTAAFGVTEPVVSIGDAVTSTESASVAVISPQKESTGEALFGVESSSAVIEVPSIVDIKSPPESTGAALFGVPDAPANGFGASVMAENPFMLDDPPPPPLPSQPMSLNSVEPSTVNEAGPTTGEISVIEPQSEDLPPPPAELLELEKPVSLITQMVGDLDVCTAGMMEKLELAKTPTAPMDSGIKSPGAESSSGSITEEASPAAPEKSSPAIEEAIPSVDIITTDEVADNQLLDEEDKTNEGGFSGIFSAELTPGLAPGNDTMQTATSFVDISEKVEEEHVEERTESEDNKVESDSETLVTGGTGAALFGDVGCISVPGGTGAALFADDNSSFAPAIPPRISTGDAIFSDVPSVPDIKSTGAAIFGISDESGAGTTGAAIFGISAPEPAKPSHGAMSGWDDNFDKKFNCAEVKPEASLDGAFGGSSYSSASLGFGAPSLGFGAEQHAFGDSFGMPPVPNTTPAVPRRQNAGDPQSVADANNPFLETGMPGPGDGKSTEPGETPETPLFDSDVSKPLERYPRLDFGGPGWEMFIRHPPKKKITSQRFWKKVWVRLVMQEDTPTILLFDDKDSKNPFQELPLQAAYSLSDISHQVFDAYAKVFTIKLQYIFYKERAGIRPGQVTKMQKLTDKIGFLAKAVEDADYQGVKEFASDMKKLGVPLEHAPQISELLKLASNNYEDLKQFSVCIEEKLFRLDVHRDRALTYKTEEVQLTAVDEIYIEQDKNGLVLKHICRNRVFFLSFLSGMPVVELGVNDMTRMGLEVVGRHDILPVPTEQWIRYEDIEFHSVVDKKAFEADDHIIRFQPPDACYIEVMRFRTRPPKSRELPIQARCNFEITGNKVVIRADMMIPYHATKAWGQVPCEDVAMRIPIPECWIYQFRTEKHNLSISNVRGALSMGSINLGTRMGSVKSAHRRAGKVKGIERFLGTMETASQELMETSSGQAKYEHQHKAIVWRVPRLPKTGQGSYTDHEFVCRLTLTSFDQMPEQFDKHFTVEFTQPATMESYTVLRSVSILEGSGDPPEKCVKYLARNEYKVEINFTEGGEKDAYRAATAAVPVAVTEEEVEEMREYEDFPEERNGKKDSDSDSD